MVTPYLIPSTEELRLLRERGPAQRRVRILTTSLEANNDPLAEAGYRHYRVRLLESGVELFELRMHPENTRGTGQSATMTRYGTYSLHTKLLVFDRSALFVGSMNYDACSRWLNTEVGLIVHSAELAAETAQRFQVLTAGERLRRHPGTRRCAGVAAAHLEHCEQSQPVSYDSEPARSAWQRFEVGSLSLFPLDHEL